VYYKRQKGRLVTKRRKTGGWNTERRKKRKRTGGWISELNRRGARRGGWLTVLKSTEDSKGKCGQFVGGGAHDRDYFRNSVNASGLVAEATDR
jgi:hypothetical protein